MIKLKAVKPKDYAEIFPIIRSAYGDDLKARYIEAIRSSADYVAELSLAAVLGKKIVGHVFFNRISIREARHNLKALVLGCISVDAEFQNQGIGSKLLNDGLQKCCALGYDVVFALGYPDFLKKFGFVPAADLGFRSTVVLSEDNFLAIELAPELMDNEDCQVEFPEILSKYILSPLVLSGS